MAVGSVGGGLGASAAAAAGTETATAIEDLPADILALVLRHLDSALLAAVGCACSGLRSASTCGGGHRALFADAFLFLAAAGHGARGGAAVGG